MPRTNRSTRPSIAAVVLAVLAALLLGACGASPEQVTAREASAPVKAPITIPVPSAVTKALVFVVENHSMAQMQSGMPWVYRIARRYGHTTAYHAVTHPSLPNYLAIAGGSTFGVHDDQSPAVHPLSGASVFGRARANHHTAKLYAESMPSRCALEPAGRYAVKHNPWAYFTGERAACRRYDVPLSALSGDITHGRLPNVGMVIPNLCNDAHDCSLSSANRWLKAKVGAVLRGPDFTSGRLAVVITADEDDYHSGNKVLTVVAQKDLHGKVVRTALTHYGLSRSLSQLSHTGPLRHARTARSVLTAFGLRIG